MLRTGIVLAAVGLLITGCGDKEEPDDSDDTGNGILPGGEPVPEIWSYIAIEGSPSWLYSREDTTQMIVDASVSQANGDDARNSLLYSVDDFDVKTQQEIKYSHTVLWIAGPTKGIEIHGYDDVEYEVPVVIARKSAFLNDVVTTTNSAGTFQSTLVGFEACPNSFSTKWTCLHIEVTGGDGEYFVGDWWLAKDWGAAIFHPEVEDQQWVLRTAN